MTYPEIYAELLDAINQGPHEQQRLVQMTDTAYAFLEELDQDLEHDQVLGLRVLIAQAESLIVRYFGM